MWWLDRRQVCACVCVCVCVHACACVYRKVVLLQWRRSRSGRSGSRRTNNFAKKKKKRTRSGVELTAETERSKCLQWSLCLLLLPLVKSTGNIWRGLPTSMVMTSSCRICLPSWKALVSPLKEVCLFGRLSVLPAGLVKWLKKLFFTSLHFGKIDNGHAIDKCRQWEKFFSHAPIEDVPPKYHDATKTKPSDDPERPQREDRSSRHQPARQCLCPREWPSSSAVWALLRNGPEILGSNSSFHKTHTSNDMYQKTFKVNQQLFWWLADWLVSCVELQELIFRGFSHLKFQNFPGEDPRTPFPLPYQCKIPSGAPVLLCNISTFSRGFYSSAAFIWGRLICKVLSLQNLKKRSGTCKMKVKQLLDIAIVLKLFQM